MPSTHSSYLTETLKTSTWSKHGSKLISWNMLRWIASCMSTLGLVRVMAVCRVSSNFMMILRRSTCTWPRTWTLARTTSSYMVVRLVPVPPASLLRNIQWQASSFTQASCQPSVLCLTSDGHSQSTISRTLTGCPTLNALCTSSMVSGMRSYPFTTHKSYIGQPRTSIHLITWMVPAITTLRSLLQTICPVSNSSLRMSTRTSLSETEYGHSKMAKTMIRKMPMSMTLRVTITSKRAKLNCPAQEAFKINHSLLLRALQRTRAAALPARMTPSPWSTRMLSDDKSWF